MQLYYIQQFGDTNMLCYAAVCLLLLVAYVIFCLKAVKINYPCKGVDFHPFLGNFATLQTMQDEMHRHVYEMSLANGFKAFELTMPTMEWLFLQTPQDAKCFLKDEWEHFAKNIDGQGFAVNFEEVLGEGIFAIDGDKWRFHRKAASRMFSANSLKHRMHSVFAEHAKKACTILRASEGKELDIQLLFSNLTFDTMSEIAFGSNVHAMDSLTKSPFLEDFDAMQGLCTKRFFAPTFVWKAMRALNLGSEREISTRAPRLKRYVMGVIAQRRQEDNLEERGDLLSMFIAHAHKSGGEPLSDAYLCDVILNYMVAGRDTTASTLTSFFKLLSQYPEVRRQFTVEAKECVDSDGNVSFDALKSSFFSLACMRETLRLYPPVGVDSRFCVRDTTFPSGLKVRRGTQVVLPAYAMGRNPHIWGDDPLTFNPMRFVDTTPNEWEWPVFWGGPRMCLGKVMAQLEFQTVACVIASQFEIDIPKVADTFATGPVLFHVDGLKGTPRAL